MLSNIKHEYSDILWNPTHFPGPLVCQMRQVPLYNQTFRMPHMSMFYVLLVFSDTFRYMGTIRFNGKETMDSYNNLTTSETNPWAGVERRYLFRCISGSIWRMLHSWGLVNYWTQ
jgi:hypothetical protein